MRLLSRAALGAALALGLAVPAAAASVDDLLNLRANGLSEDLLVALVQTDGSSFDLSPDDVLALHQKGLGDRVIAAMLKTAPRRDERGTRHDARPSTDNAGLRPVIRTSAAVAVIAVPAVVAVPSSVADTVAVVAVPTVVVVAPAAPAAPYWGFGGRLRPGSWNPR